MPDPAMNWPKPPVRYLIVGIESGVAWPAAETKIEFRGVELTLRPESEDRAPTVLVSYSDPVTHDSMLRIVHEFLSSWAWVEGAKLEVGLISGGGSPHHVGKMRPASMITRELDFPYLPDPSDPKARLALAFYREALNLDNISYKFLGFFKILNITNSTGSAQKDWIRQAIPALHDSSAQQRIAELSNSGVDVAEYLYTSGRCAVAHAFANPLVNPEEPEDLRRLYQDLPVIKALAEYLIEKDLGIKSRRTVWKEHLYELEGFRSLFGSDLVQRIKNKEKLVPEDLPRIPRLTLGIYKQQSYRAFSSMDVRILEIENGCVWIEAVAAGGLSGIIIGLNFAQERLLFDPEQNVFILNRQDVVTGENIIDQLSLIKALVCNGQLEVWNAEDSTLLGRTDPCIPVNIDSGRTISTLDHKIQHIQEEIAWHQYFATKK